MTGSKAQLTGEVEETSVKSSQDSPRATYEALLREGKLGYQFSVAADKAVFFPRTLCPFTGSTSLEWRVSAGIGTVHATTVVYPVSGAPFNVALIDCDEGFRLMSRVDGVDPADVRIGMRVKVSIRDGEGDEAPLPVFVPLENAG